MIFINLLPDIKLDFVRAQRVRRLLVLLSVVIVLCCFLISSFLFFVVEVQQPATIREIEGDRPQTGQPAGEDSGEEGGDQGEDAPVASFASAADCSKNKDSNICILEEIRSNEDGNTILTIQNQLKTLPELHKLKTRPDRLFREPSRSNDLAYLSLLVPEDLGTIESAEFNFETYDFSISGYSKDTADALSVHATIRFMGYEGCYDDESGSNRDNRIYPFKINDEPVSGPVGNDQDRVSFQIDGIFSEQLFDREISDKDLGSLGKVPQDAVDPAKLKDPNHPCKLPAGEDNIDNPDFEKLTEWWKAS